MSGHQHVGVDGARRERVTAKLKELGFRFVTLDLEGYRRGSAKGDTGVTG